MTDYTAPTSKGDSYSSSTQPRPILPGYIRFRKVPDFGNAATNCFDFEEAVSFLASPVVTDEKNRKGLLGNPVFLVDPCQQGNSPLKTQTLLPSSTNQATIASNALAGVFTGRFANQNGSIVVLEDIMLQSRSIVSALNTATVVTFEIRNEATIIAIHMVTSAGTATITVEGTIDNSNFLQLDSIAAAAATDLQYTLATNALNGAAQAGTVAGTGASTVKLNPLAFRWVRITAGAAGAGNTTTLTVAVK